MTGPLRSLRAFWSLRLIASATVFLIAIGVVGGPLWALGWLAVVAIVLMLDNMRRVRGGW